MSTRTRQLDWTGGFNADDATFARLLQSEYDAHKHKNRYVRVELAKMRFEGEW
ncbi:hypothetical protein INS49_009779 [Diaporthe citri]|uniref:uncharacterized protein n=1 Tax=Diaporthe citri TaxID=83186 RepID=UPI001C81FC8A|nr:uncharacterized protein INS49_009779 [Diaporthe citri]KAG6361552.1 hypothetical protein INS49_009779 [Diaporthe citri]